MDEGDRVWALLPQQVRKLQGLRSSAPIPPALEKLDPSCCVAHFSRGRRCRRVCPPPSSPLPPTPQIHISSPPPAPRLGVS